MRNDIVLNLVDLQYTEFPSGRKRKQIIASVYSPEELKASLDSFVVPEGFTRLQKGKCDTSGTVICRTNIPLL